MAKLNKEATNEIVELLTKVQDVQRLLHEWGIYITSDPWSATSFSNKENILCWDKKDFEELTLDDGDKFYVGGNIVTGSEHKYNGEYLIAPKKLAKVEGEIFEEYLKSVMHSISLKHFKLEFKDEYGLIDNCGWEHYMCIVATVEKSAVEKKTEQLLEQILNESDFIIETSASPIYENPQNEFHPDTKLQPKGRFAYMVEFFSDCINYEEDEYQGEFGVNSKYIKDAMKMITEVENRAKEIEDKYSEKGVKVTVNGMNDGCEYGMAIYVWIPFQ